MRLDLGDELQSSPDMTFEDDTDWDDDSAEDDSCPASIWVPQLDCRKAQTRTTSTDTLVQKSLLLTKRELIERLMGHFWAIFNQNWAGQLQTRSGSSDSSSTGATSNSGAHHQTSSRTKKRKCDNVNDNEDGNASENGHERDPNGPQNCLLGNDEPSTPFACPYRKHNPRQYGIENWKSCALTSFTTIARLKCVHVLPFVVYPKMLMNNTGHTCIKNISFFLALDAKSVLMMRASSMSI